MWRLAVNLRGLASLCVVWACVGLAKSRTIDEIIAGASNDVRGFDFMNDINGNVVRVELDMLMTVKQYQSLYTDDDDSSTRHKRKAIKSDNLRWTNKQIPYTIDGSIFSDSDTTEIMAAIREWETFTCMKFRPAIRTDENVVNFVDGIGCSSYVGMNGGKHPITLAVNCRQKGVIVHEIGHAVGFFHEQNRPDRDQYITIHEENLIDPNLIHNFQKYPWSDVSTFNVPYDYASIMHYGSRAFSKNGQHTIRTKDPAFQDVIGRREGLSFNDIKLANLMYSCNEKCGQNIQCPEDGFVDKDCQCKCRGNPVQICNGSATRITTQRPIAKTTVNTITCQDMNGNCGAWAESGFCMTNNYVKTYCKKSCSLCDGGRSPEPQCKDMRTNCFTWSDQGFCGSPIYKTFMTEKCPVACGVCKKSHEHIGGGDNNGQEIASVSLLLLLTFAFGCLVGFM